MLAKLAIPLSWRELLKRTSNEFVEDDAFNLAAQQAYYFFFALFPALLMLLSVASFFPIANAIDEIVRSLGRLVPPDVLTIITDQIKQISSSEQGGILTVGFLLTLWSSSGALVSIVTTLNAAFDITESRPWWKVRLIAIGLTLGTVLFILGSLALVLIGPTVAEHLATSLRLGDTFKWTWWILQWPVVLILVATGIGLVYHFAPDVDQEWVWLTAGSVVATLLWVLVSLGFKLYISYFGSYNKTYGAIGAVIMLLTWLYLSSLTILLGAELNSEIEHASPGRVRPSSPAGPGGVETTAVVAGVGNRSARGRSVATGGMRASDWLIGGVALLPAAIQLGRAAAGAATAVRSAMASASTHQDAASHPSPSRPAPDSSAAAAYPSGNAGEPGSTAAQ